MAVLRKCPVCGLPGRSCGPRSTAVGLDPMNAPRRREEPAMAIREYTVTVNGAETTMLLSAKDAERMGGTPVGDAPEPSEPDTPTAGEADDDTPATKARPAQNKARHTANKAG